MPQVDVLVIGAGPAGVSAAIYLARFGVSVALVEKLAPGGLLLQTFAIENYPGFPKGVKGYELADLLAEQLAPYSNISRIVGEVTELSLTGETKTARVDDTNIEARAVIVTSGVRYRKMGLPREEEFLGKGISHCALCDGNFFRGQRIAVVGGGNSAVEEALHLAKIVAHMHIIHRRSEFRAAPIYLERLKALSNVTLELNSVITGLHGSKILDGLTIKRVDSGREDHLAVDGLFVFIGFNPAADFLPTGLSRDAHGFIETDTEMRTNIPGVFAAGDVRSKLCRQVVTAVGDGATAANSAHTYLEQLHV
ncbi:FAD-dependent oxidoreductase [Desulfovibrio sp. OttesenSCG-928-G15]|nr:FAD-dependent oxidoreductase [Desulfovibrio sp. OttesenSCG-928-G15]